MTEDNFKQLLKRIVDSHLPDEDLIFELEGDEIVESIFKMQNVNHTAIASNNLQAVDMSSAAAIVGLVPVAMTCYKTYLELRKLLHDDKLIDQEEVRKSWLKKLRQHGMTEKKATLIVDDFTQDIIQFAK